nr:MAG TPA: hypothetical protein [Caudoviricetes sp.]
MSCRMTFKLGFAVEDTTFKNEAKERSLIWNF